MFIACFAICEDAPSLPAASVNASTRLRAVAGTCVGALARGGRQEGGWLMRMLVKECNGRQISHLGVADTRPARADVNDAVAVQGPYAPASWKIKVSSLVGWLIG